MVGGGWFYNINCHFALIRFLSSLCSLYTQICLIRPLLSKKKANSSECSSRSPRINTNLRKQQAARSLESDMFYKELTNLSGSSLALCRQQRHTFAYAAVGQSPTSLPNKNKVWAIYRQMGWKKRLACDIEQKIIRIFVHWVLSHTEDVTGSGMCCTRSC